MKDTLHVCYLLCLSAVLCVLLLQLDPNIRQQGNPTSCKIVLFGADGVGKTSIMRYFLGIPPEGQGFGIHVSLITALYYRWSLC